MELTSNWQGSLATAKMVAEEISNRWGEEEVKVYDPAKNCFTYQGWKQRGFQVRRGEKGIKSITFIREDGTNAKTGEIEVRSYPKRVTLFYKTQVDRI